MPSDPQWFDEPNDELDDNDFPDEYDSDDELTETVPCPQCGADVYEDAVRCPVCGAYVTFNNNVWSGRPGWWIVLGILGTLAVILVLAGMNPW